MKLIYYIILRITLALTLILTIWAVFFYVTMIDEVNDEVDDSLEDYSETIIIRALAGEELPSENNGSNNQYYLTEVTKEYAGNRNDIQYKDSMVYIVEKGETEPAPIRLEDIVRSPPAMIMTRLWVNGETVTRNIMLSGKSFRSICLMEPYCPRFPPTIRQQPSQRLN